MKEKIINEIKPFLPWLIAAMVLVVWFIFAPQIDRTGVLDKYRDSEKKNQGKIEVYEKNAKKDSIRIVELEDELIIIRTEKDSLSGLVDEFEPDIVNTIEYITSDEVSPMQVDSAKRELVRVVQIIKLERKALQSTVSKQDDIITAQKGLIADLNSQIVLLNQSNISLKAINKGLEKQIRKEVRKRRLTVVGSAAAIVGVIFITSR